MKSVDVTFTIKYADEIEGDVAFTIEKMVDPLYNIGYSYEELNVSYSNPLD